MEIEPDAFVYMSRNCSKKSTGSSYAWCSLTQTIRSQTSHSTAVNTIPRVARFHALLALALSTLSALSISLPTLIPLSTPVSTQRPMNLRRYICFACFFFLLVVLIPWLRSLEAHHHLAMSPPNASSQKTKRAKLSKADSNPRTSSIR